MALIAVSVVGVALAVAARDDDSGTDRAGGVSTGAGPTSTSAPATTTTTRPRRGSNQPVTLAFGGDTHFEGNLASLLRSNPSGMFAPIAPTLAGADVAMVNLETAIATGGSPDPKNYNFRAPPSAFEALRAAGVDVVTMANNHGRDYGPEGLAETLSAKQQTPLKVLGIGANATEAYAPWITEVKGQRLAFFAATDVLDDWLITPWTATDTQAGLASTKDAAVDRLVAGIRAVRPTVDTVVVDLHWGVEGATCPSPRQQELARQLIAAGADVIVGSHAHRVMTAGRLDGALRRLRPRQLRVLQRVGPVGGHRRAAGHGDRPRRRRVRVAAGAHLRRDPAPAERERGSGRRRRVRVPAGVRRTHPLTGATRGQPAAGGNGSVVSSTPSSRSTRHTFSANETMW